VKTTPVAHRLLPKPVNTHKTSNQPWPISPETKKAACRIEGFPLGSERPTIIRSNAWYSSYREETIPDQLCSFPLDSKIMPRTECPSPPAKTTYSKMRQIYTDRMLARCQLHVHYSFGHCPRSSQCRHPWYCLWKSRWNSLES
jgi:hypothetical protein